MPRKINFNWFKKQAKDGVSRQRIGQIEEWRRRIYKNNQFLKGSRLFPLRLGKYVLWFSKSNAFSSIEVYYEIFKEKNHFLVPEFREGEDSVVVDIGANEGFYALKMREYNSRCKIICIEPNPYAFKILSKNIRSNMLKNIILINKAAAFTVRKINFKIIKEINAIGSRDIKIAPRPWLKDEFVSEIKVQALPLSNIMHKYNISHVDLLKIDTEGMEDEVIRGALPKLRNIHKIVAEIHSDKLRNKLLILLQKSGFRLVFEEKREKPARYYADLYFINNNFRENN